MFNSPAVQDANSLVWFRLITEIPSFSAAEGCNPREKLRTYEALDVSCDPFAPRRQYQGQVTHAVITKGKARPELLERLDSGFLFGGGSSQSSSRFPRVAQPPLAIAS